MTSVEALDDQWPFILTMLPEDLDLEASSREMGALVRRRGITSAEDLLRLAMVYGACGYSLRQTAAWAETARIAKLSDVAVLKRLRKAAPWLGKILMAQLAHRTQTRVRAHSGLRIRLVDASCISKPGSKGTDWRLHLGLDLGTLTVDDIEITDAKGGETLKRFAHQPGELIVGDRGYAHRAGMAAVREAGSDFLVRINWQNVPLSHSNGEAVDFLRVLRGIRDTEILDLPVHVASGSKATDSTYPVRLIATRKSEPAAAEERRRIRRERAKKGRTADARTLEAAGYVLLLTSVRTEVLDAEKLLELYRFRWQIELTFKRFKSLLDLDGLPAKDPALARTFLYMKLLSALILEDFTEKFQDVSPWGYRLPASTEPVADSSDAA